MFLWVGAVFDSKTENEIRNAARTLNRNYGLSEVAFSLPQHISLKISFECDDHKSVFDFIKSRFAVYSLFEVDISDIEKIDGSLIWLKIAENETLRKMHNLLNESLSKEFGIPLKSFDGDAFKFHSTLFQDEGITTGHQKLMCEFKNLFSIPRKCEICEINFGTAENLIAGEFTVVDKLILK